LELQRDRLGKWDVVHHFLLFFLRITRKAARSAPD
jgi:hypothetical protein